jgi:beta-glucosidase
MKLKIVINAGITCLILSTIGDISATETSKSDAITKRANSLIAKMTLKEKISLCYSKSKFANSSVARLGIPAMKFSDGPHGVREECMLDSFAKDPNFKDDDCTYLPTGTALAATRNPKLTALHGKVLGNEARNRGKDVILGPGFNIIRTPCGRNFEYYRFPSILLLVT